MRTLNLVLAGAVPVVIIAVVVLGAMYEGRNPPADAHLSLSDFSPEPEQNSSTVQPQTSRLRFAIGAVLSPRATLDNYEALASYLGEQLDRPVEIVQGKSYAETNALVRSGDVALALVCSGAYVFGRSDFGMQPLVIPVVNGETVYYSYLIVPYNSSVRTWEDLRHKTFAFTDPLSNTGRLVPVYVLSQMGETPEGFFKDFIFTYSHDKSVQAVADGLVDGAAVDSLVYDYLILHDPVTVIRTEVIWKSPPYGINPVVVSPGIAPELRQRLKSVLLGMHTNPEGRKVLAQLGIDSFVVPADDAYDEIERMIRETAIR